MDHLGTLTEQPAHGGRLNAAVQRTGIEHSRWLDLSTGINPHPWPVPELPAAVWQRLPETDDGLDAVIRRWSGAPPSSAVLPIPGSQAAIQLLPRLRPHSRVGIVSPAYSEHAFWWQAAGHEVIALDHQAIEQQLDELDVLVCINPNNPTGARIEPQRLKQAHSKLAERGGWLVVDEAFADGYDGISLIPATGTDGLFVMRSLGKYFGLAGLRAGVLFGPPAVLRGLEAALGPWALSHPARYLMGRALDDHAWQYRTREHLAVESERLRVLLVHYGLPPAGGTLLFQYCPCKSPGAIAQQLEKQALLVRTFDQPGALRFGLPGSQRQWQHLGQALAQLTLP